MVSSVSGWNERPQSRNAHEPVSRANLSWVPNATLGVEMPPDEDRNLLVIRVEHFHHHYWVVLWHHSWNSWSIHCALVCAGPIPSKTNWLSHHGFLSEDWDDAHHLSFGSLWNTYIPLLFEQQVSQWDLQLVPLRCPMTSLGWAHPHHSTHGMHDHWPTAVWVEL